MKTTAPFCESNRRRKRSRTHRVLRHRQTRLSIAQDGELEHSALHQPPQLATSELRKDCAPRARIRLIHRVREHRLHHHAFLRIRLPETALEVCQDMSEGRFVPTVRTSIETHEVIEHR